MSITTTIIRLLEDGKPRTLTEICEITGYTRVSASNIIGHLMAKKFLDARPVCYSINDAGRERAKVERKPKAKAAPKPSRPRKTRAIEARRIPTDTMVSKSILKRPALEQAWGVFHA